MEQPDPRLEIVAKLDIQRFRLRKKRPIVLLFGGELEEEPDTHRYPYKSVRDGLRRRYTSAQWLREAIRIAEDYKDWLYFDQYEDLISFEKDLASACSLVAIVLESPGTLAELGAFSQIEDVSKRMCVFVTETHKNSRSFISLGLLKPLSAQERVHVYPWQEDDPRTISEELLNEVSSDIEDHIRKLPAEPIFDSKISGHVMFLICELLKLFLALKEQEIFNYLKALGIHLQQKTVNQYLYTLRRLEIITACEYSSKTFYMTNRDAPPYSVRLATKADSSEQLDEAQIISDIAKYYRESPKENHRNKAINSALSRSRHDHS